MGERHDAIVIGGGPAGATAGLLLARAGWDVVLLERKSFPRRKVCGEYLSATNLALLRGLGLDGAFLGMAGPPVTQVGLFAGTATLRADLPHLSGPGGGWGRALGRETLDAWLLETARAKGVQVLQPWSPIALSRHGQEYVCLARSADGRNERELRAAIVVAAHGSWELGPLPTQPGREETRPGDLFGFKAHFRGSRLPERLMPLLAFPDGYGGMVHCDGGRVSLSCCVRRDRLARLARSPNQPAGEAVLHHILAHCRGAQAALEGAIREGDWLAAGPIRPGIHLQSRLGLFQVGNTAGEAHPVVAEGISMAMQGSWLLCGFLQRWRASGASAEEVKRVNREYARAWRRRFAPRLHASTLVAEWAMRPAAVSLALPLLRWFPRVLTWGARCSGKATRVVW